MEQILIPIPIPGVSKSLLPGGKQIRKNTFLRISLSINKFRTNPFVRYCLMSKGFLFNNYENYSSRFVFPKGPKRGNPSMTASTITARRKGDPQHMLREIFVCKCSKSIF